MNFLLVTVIQQRMCRAGRDFASLCAGRFSFGDSLLHGGDSLARR
jgi:hypothetical protein